MSPAEIATRWQQNERAEGRCPRCRRQQTDINPRTGRPFWRCAFCRNEQRQEAKTRYDAQKARFA